MSSSPPAQSSARQRPDTQQQPHELSSGLVLLLSVTAGLSVAALYFAQPLLVMIAHGTHTNSSDASYLVTASQVGYVLGLAFLVPLGDTLDRRKLLTGVLVIAALASLGAAWAPSFWVLAVALVATGITASAAMVVVPLAATLASPERRGSVTGTVMSGLLMGILLARTVSGGIAQVGGWRSVFVIAALLDLALAVCIQLRIPVLPQHASHAYPQLLKSVVDIVRREPILRGRMVLGFLSMCGFSLMWTASTFLLSHTYHLSPGVIGLFGLAGVAGAMGAPVMGRLADRGHARLGATIAWSSVVVGWVFLAIGGHYLWMLVIGLLVFDFGAQSVQLSNQNRIYGLDPAARSRITTGYMVLFFLGGVLGSLLVPPIYSAGGWNLTCGVGIGIGVLGLLSWGLIARTVERP